MQKPTMKLIKPITKFNKKDYVIDLETGEMIWKKYYFGNLKREENIKQYTTFFLGDGKLKTIHKPPYPPALPNELRPLNFEAPSYVEFHCYSLKPIKLY
jgi:hypothetical protein